MKVSIFILCLSLSAFPKVLAAGVLPTDVEICKGGTLTKSQKGDAIVSIEDGNSCVREAIGDPVDIFGLWRVEWCDEKTGECTITQYESPIDKEKNKLLLGRGDKPYKDRSKGFDCVSSSTFSSIFSSLGGCSGSSAGRDDKPKSPKPEPNMVGGTLRLRSSGSWNRGDRFEVRKALETMISGFNTEGRLRFNTYTNVNNEILYSVGQDAGSNVSLTTLFVERPNGSVSFTVVITVETAAVTASKKYVQMKEILVGYIDKDVQYQSTGNIDGMSLKDLFSSSKQSSIREYIRKTWDYAQKSRIPLP